MKLVPDAERTFESENNTLEAVLSELQKPEESEWYDYSDGYIAFDWQFESKGFVIPTRCLAKILDDEDGRPHINLLFMGFGDKNIRKGVASLMEDVSNQYHVCFVSKDHEDTVCAEAYIYDDGESLEQLLGIVAQELLEIMTLVSELILFNEGGVVQNGKPMTKKETRKTLLELLCTNPQIAM